ncbi:MAG: response regulator [Planctomycetales bacterium]|nr:response regulator [Planctomycetales bacterium]
MYTVLVADDSGVVRSVVKRALLDLGIESIDEANNGRDAIEFIANNSYDLIVTDWNMPEYTGLDVVRAARAAGQHCPIIMQTTVSDRGNVMLAIQAGVNDYVLKPFSKEEISEKMEQYVGVCKTASANS